MRGFIVRGGDYGTKQNLPPKYLEANHGCTGAVVLDASASEVYSHP